ncbi:MAG: uridine diphosphate-N-acetylglucosamine-binding protein YvcK [Candidatus Omnitrophota bacterium]
MGKKVLVVSARKEAENIYSVLDPLGVVIKIFTDAGSLKDVSGLRGIDVVILEEKIYSGIKESRKKKLFDILKRSKKKFMVVSSRKALSAVIEARDLGAADFICSPYHHREFIARFNAVAYGKKRITCLGGGTGLFHILMGFKEIPDTLLTSVVSMTDDGGSSGKLKASFGILPPGDIRRSLVALSDAPEIMNQLMKYRFQRGGHFVGHSVGNLFLAALAEITGSFPEAVKMISDVLNVRGIVLPVTDTQTTLCASFEDGTVIKGESKIDSSEGKHPDLRIRDIWHEPETKCTIDAFAAIINSDIVTIGPGDLFTSVSTNLVVKDIRKAVSGTKALKVYICNLMTKPGETSNCDVYDHVSAIIKYLGEDSLDHVIISNTKLSAGAISEYALKKQYPVETGSIERLRGITKAKIILADVGHATELVRHESEKIKNQIWRLLRAR